MEFGDLGGRGEMVGRIIIADDHPLFREGLRRIIQRVMTASIVEVTDTDSLLSEARKNEAPIMMLLDLVFPGFKGAETVADLRQAYPGSALVVISMTDDNKVAKEMIAAGANGFISKSVSPDEILLSINKIVEGEIVVCLDGDDAIGQSIIPNLPQRHIDVLVGIGQGKTNKEIARELGISPFTVRAHISAVFKSMGVSTRSAASAKAVLYGLI